MPASTDGFTRADLREISAAILKALDEVQDRFNIQIEQGRGTYGPTASLKLEISRLNEAGVAETEERADFRRSARLVGLEPEMLDKEFTHNGSTFRISGLNLRASKMPVLAVHTGNGKSYKFGAETVRLLMKV